CDAALAEILELPYGERDVPVTSVTEKMPVLAGPIGLASRVVSSIDTKGALAAALERARIPMRPGEYVIVAAAAAVVLSAVLVAVTTQWIFALLGVALVALGAVALPRRLVARRRKAFEAQLPDALSLIAGSLAAGHTFLRSIQMMCEESEPPLAEEFARVVHETQLGDSVVDALDRMAGRLEVRDLSWVVQAIRIQQTVGGKLADLLHTLADFLRAREELRREVNVLTAEGRISAWVLGALPVFLLLAVQVISPDYMRPMFHGGGLVMLAVAAACVVAGIVVIRHMVRIEV
ncbi:MAG: hypothetical protein C4344_06865, partial [Acidimicrobiia bacterium]